MDVKTVNVIVKNNSTAIFHGQYSYRPHKWRQNVQNFALKQLACGSLIHLSFEYPNVISMVNKSTDHGKLLSIC